MYDVSVCGWLGVCREYMHACLRCVHVLCVCVCVCVCVCARARARACARVSRPRGQAYKYQGSSPARQSCPPTAPLRVPPLPTQGVNVCVCVCVCARARVLGVDVGSHVVIVSIVCVVTPAIPAYIYP